MSYRPGFHSFFYASVFSASLFQKLDARSASSSESVSSEASARISKSIPGKSPFM